MLFQSLFGLVPLLSLATAAALPSPRSLSVRDTSLPSGWTASTVSCISEGSTGRALTGSSTTSSNMTAGLCASFCASAGYSIAGIEYSSECYCGNALTNGATTTLSTSCTMPCSGDANSTCGGPNALNLYVSSTASLISKVVTLPSGWSSSGCIAEASSGRALASASTSSSSMTVGTCISYCSSLGFQYAGVEYSSECYCGDSLTHGASLSTTSNQCTMLCSGDSSITCGGSGALQVYNNPALSLVNTKSNGYSLQGCIQEVSGRALTGATKVSDSMTVDTCTSYCSSQGFTYAGLEYASECYCGSALSNGASASSLSTQCYMTCAGDSTKNCGGPNAIQLYYNAAVTPPVGVIKMYYADDNSFAGYIKKTIDRNVYNSYLGTTDPSLAVKAYRPTLDTDSQNLVITPDTMLESYKYLALQVSFSWANDEISYSTNNYGYLLPAASTFSPGPAQFLHNWWTDKTGYNRDSEAALWRVDSSTGKITPKWINPSGASVTPTLYMAVSNNPAWIGMTGNLGLTQSYFSNIGLRAIYLTWVAQ